MTEQPQVNIKTLPPHPTADDLYNYVYNRKERRSHTPAKKLEIKRKLLDNYYAQVRKAQEAKALIEKEVKNEEGDRTSL